MPAFPMDMEKKIQQSAVENFDRTVYGEVRAGPAVARLYAVIECHRCGSLVSISRVKDMYWFKQSSGFWTLEDEHTNWYMAGIPGLSVVLTGMANIVIATTAETAGSFSISALQIAGFDISNSVRETYYLRKPIETEYKYSVF